MTVQAFQGKKWLPPLEVGLFRRLGLSQAAFGPLSGMHFLEFIHAAGHVPTKRTL